jgi:hypothetical protein
VLWRVAICWAAVHRSCAGCCAGHSLALRTIRKVRSPTKWFRKSHKIIIISVTFNFSSRRSETVESVNGETRSSLPSLPSPPPSPLLAHHPLTRSMSVRLGGAPSTLPTRASSVTRKADALVTVVVMIGKLVDARVDTREMRSGRG